MNENPDLWRDQLKRIETAQAEGLDIRGQVISRPIGILMGHIATMSPFYKRPSYVAVADLLPAERAAKLKDPARKAQILAEENDNPHIFVQLLSTNFGACIRWKTPSNIYRKTKIRLPPVPKPKGVTRKNGCMISW